MNIFSSLLVAVGLSMDNWAVTIASGCACRQKIAKTYIFKVSSLFSVAHFVMFSAGWLCGAGLGKYIGAVDHWIAFFILVFIGGRMIQSAMESAANEQNVCGLHSFKMLSALAVATSLDALLVGMGLAFTAAPFWITVCMLTVCVFVTSWSGFYVGSFLGRKFGKVMEALGGIVLVFIGLKLLLEGVGIW